MTGNNHDDPEYGYGCAKVLIGIALIVALLLAIGEASKAQSMIDCKIDSVLKCRDIPPFTRKLIIAQARLESGNYNSKLYQEHCNLFATQHPKRRPTYSKGPYGSAEGRKNRYASFNSVEESVEDHLLYFNYIEEKPHSKSTAQYVRKLKANHYFESSEQKYINGIKTIIKKSLSGKLYN
jgi:uncharacterized FlgJ-related protein